MGSLRIFAIDLSILYYIISYPFWYLLFLFFILFVVFALFLFDCFRWSFADVPLIFSCPVDHVLDWHPRILLLGMIEAHPIP